MEESIHWVFVLIAGSVILLVFGTFIYKAKFSAEKEASVDLVNDLSLIFTGSEISSKTVNKIDDMPDIPIEFDCDELTIGTTRLGYNSKIVFAPKESKSNTMLVWSYDWKAPFFVTNFIYISNPDTKYYFVYDQLDAESKQMKEEFQELMPEFFKYDFLNRVQLIALKHPGFKNIRFIFLNYFDTSKHTLHNTFRGQSYSGIFLGKNGELNYLVPKQDGFDAKSNTADAYYLDTASMLGALFSQDKELYTCSMGRALKRHKILSGLLEARSVKIDAATDACLYPTGLFDLTTATVSSVPTAFNAKLTTLKNANELLQKKSCPLLY